MPNQTNAASLLAQVVTITPEQAAQAAQEQARRREYQEKQKALVAARQAKLDAERNAAQERAAEASRQAWAWFARVVIRFGWFQRHVAGRFDPGLRMAGSTLAAR